MKTNALWTASSTCCPYSDELAAELTFQSENAGSFTCFHRVGDYMLVPRGYRGEYGEDRMTLTPLGAINCTKPPRTAEQAKIIEDAGALFKERNGFIINAPTGFGKTYLGVAIAGKLGQATLIVTHKNDLHKNWQDAATDLAGLPKSALGHVQQDVCDYKGRRFVLASLQSLIIPDRYPPDFYKHFGMVIFDEVHKLGSDEFSKACTLFSARYRLGLSATTDRWDGRDQVFRLHIGPVLLKGITVPMSPKVIVRKTNWRPPMAWQRDDNDQWVNEPLRLQPGRMIRAVKAMAADEDRNTLIVDFVRAAYNKGRAHIVIMSDLIEGHLTPLFHRLAKAGIPGEDMGFYTGKQKTEAARKTNAMRRVVLATYQFTDTGTDFPPWDTLVLATPRADVRQAVGRVLRSMEGKRTPVVLDLVDPPKLLEGFHAARLKQYFQLGAEIVRIKP